MRHFLKLSNSYIISNTYIIISNMAQFTSIVRHAESSLGEGSPVLYRIMMDQFTGYLPGYNNVSTNYTGARGISLLIQDESDRQGSYVEVVVSLTEKLQ